MSEKVSTGDVLAGKYRVERVLGSGGMGVVVAARHIQLDVLVALKFMTDEAFGDSDLVARFLREARAAARLRSEHVARVTDVGTLDSGAPYLVMEYLEGSDLSAVLSNEGPQPISTAVEYIVQACDALDEAHNAGIVHRDIKPSNLFLTRRPNGTSCVKVLDFGISKSDRLGSSSTKLHATHSRAVLGSPFYMSPEQMRAAREVDARADIWALGATLYELLTGRVPFEANSLLDLALQIAQGDPQPLSKSRPEVPWTLEQIVSRCLEKDREDRFATAKALASALAPLAPRPESASRGMLSFAAWRDETAIESSKDEVTQIAKSPEVKVVTEPAPAPQRAPFPRTLASSPDGPTPVSEDDAPVPGIDTTLPLPWSAKGPVPPVAASAPRGWRTGARLSWGRSQKLLHKRARTAWALAGFGLLVTCAAVGGSVLRSRQSSSAVRVIASVGDGETASAVGAAGTAPIGMPRTAGTGIGSESTSAQSLSHVPVVSVTDLPPAAQPPLSPSTPRVPSVTLGSASSRAKGSAEPVSHARTPLPMRSTASGAGAALANPTSDPLANPN